MSRSHSMGRGVRALQSMACTSVWKRRASTFQSTVYASESRTASCLILGDIAVLEYPCVEKKKSYTMRLTQFNDYSMVDWTPVDDTWGHGRLEFGEMEGVTRLIDNSGKFWTFGEEYSDADVERRRRVVLGHTAPALTNDFVAAAPTCASTDSSRSLRARGTRCK